MADLTPPPLTPSCSPPLTPPAPLHSPHPPPPLLCLAALVWPLPSLAGGRSRCPELANNNQGVALCDTPSLGLDNEQAPDSRFAGEWQPLEHGPMRAEDWAWEWGGEGRGGEGWGRWGGVTEAECMSWLTLACCANMLMQIKAVKETRKQIEFIISVSVLVSREEVLLPSMKIWCPPSSLHP